MPAKWRVTTFAGSIGAVPSLHPFQVIISAAAGLSSHHKKNRKAASKTKDMKRMHAFLLGGLEKCVVDELTMQHATKRGF